MGRPLNSKTEDTDYNTGAAPLSQEALLTLIVQMQAQLAESQKQAAEANEKLAAAIIETTKPREAFKTEKELAREANEKMFDDQAKELRRRQRETARAEQDECVHIAGCSALSEQKDIAGRTSILWHRNDVGVDVGICTVCQRIFHPSDPEDKQGHSYTFWRKQPSFNKISAAGHRTVLNPIEAREKSYLHDS